MAAACYRFVVRGALGRLYASAFEGMQIDFDGEVSTIVGPIGDQAQLQGLLTRIASLGLELVSVTQVDV
jgi:hypothetical protein